MMMAEALVPECMHASDDSGAGARWRDAGMPALDLVTESDTGDGVVRLGSPWRPSWLNAGQGWRPLPADLVCRLRLADQRSQVRLLATPRGLPEPVLAVLAETSQPDGILTGHAAAWLGWPQPYGDETAALTIGERLAVRSNDFWPVELASAALGLGSLVDSPMPHLPYGGGVSIVVPARDVHDVLDNTVDAIITAAENLGTTPWECMIVDDASDPPLAASPHWPPQVRLIRADTQVYCGGARNLGVGAARFDLVVFCDADTLMAPGYLVEHVARHHLAPNLVTVSLRDQMQAGQPLPERPPDGSHDTRAIAHYQPGRLGLVPVAEPVTVRALDQTRQFRDFGRGRHLGPVDLPFMVKGNNLALSRQAACRVRFPPDFVGWGPEDVCFGAKLIAQGWFVVPILATGVFHVNHPPRSGSAEQRDRELTANLRRYAAHLDTAADSDWRAGSP